MIKYGKMPFAAWSNGSLDTPVITFNTLPTGGVIKPIDVFRINSTPKYTGSIPASSINGINTGVKIKTVGVKSITIPITNTANITTSNKTVGLPSKGSSNSVNMAGNSATVINQPVTLAAATKNRIFFSAYDY